MTSLRQTARPTHEAENGLKHRKDSRLGRVGGLVLSPFSFLLEAVSAPRNHGLVKCVIAYFIASLAVFDPQFADLIGHGDGKHFVATCTVYFHPSRSTGSMIQATLYAIIALSWAVIVSVASMATAIGFNTVDQRGVGHAVVLVVYVFGGVGFIGYWKQRMADPTVGVAASMASMVIFFNITREGSIQLGEFSTRKVLQYFFIVVLGLAISNLVNYVLWPVSASHNLKKDMFKTTDQFSHFLSLVTRRFLQQSPSESLEKSFTDAVATNQTVFASLQRNLNESRYEYFIKGREDEYTLLAKITKSMKNLAQHLNALKASCDAQMDLVPEQSNGSSHILKSTDTAQEERTDGLVRAFIFHLGPPMKSLAYTTKQALREMPFDENYMVNLPSQLFINIDRALSLYEEARSAALDEMYQDRPRTPVHHLDEIADREEICASMDYFSYSLQEFVCETREMMYCLKELEAYHTHMPSRSWRFLLFWKSSSKRPKSRKRSAQGQVSPPTAKLLPRLAKYWEGVQLKLWKALRALRNKNLRFAMKVGGGAAIFALPAMIDSLRPIFVEWRLEWGLLSFFIILNSSVGGTYSAAFWRVTGSALGTGLAMVAWSLFPAERYALAPIGACIAAPCMWMIINPTKANAQFGRFILLSYNLTALYAYSISRGVLDNDDDEGGLRPIISLIALHRIVSVTAGCLWGAVVNTYIWPIKARVELREGLSMVWLRLGWKWGRDPFIHADHGGAVNTRMKDSEKALNDNLELQGNLASLRALLVQSPNEPRLRGKFPTEKYAELLKHTQSVLDATYALYSALQKVRALDSSELELLSMSRRARCELGDLIFLHFYILASAIRLNLPLPAHAPRVSDARDRLLVKISEARNSGSGTEQDYSASFIYTLMTAQMCRSLDGISEVMTDLFGTVEAFDLENDYDEEI
ncbi:Putative uncharacterized protein [Taphrina deformans PYCC 5710]|uniref:Uncharacterized protein n=1 Tax=Taphrina deformans (strain PYCC 5710 / ATCC 11124 / CBS 356.35 / IMI 108563 / JCM 9778 / NBRC 8474) TaxID=1097556 RepID=R4X9R2_TAPDE|nr:Putative uncharacterized protein [Taphrina deformans PYCC 5710]|eukprot:CCG82470.1 Putative uncharacterized protein [Taphrina deformans PYCC 5710]